MSNHDANDSASRPAHRTLRDASAREHQVLVKMNADEFETVAALAAACGLGKANYLRSRGMSPLESSGESVMTLPQKRAWIAELYAVKRVLRGSTTNLNQLTKAANATGEVPAEAWHHIERISRMEERVTALLEAIDPELKPRS